MNVFKGDKMGNRMRAGVFCLVVFALGCMTASSQPRIKINCGEALQLTSDSATRKDWGGTSTWEAIAHEDTLVLSRKGKCGDECGYEEKIVFTKLATDCPTLVSATVSRTDSGSPVPTPQVKTASSGSLKIQDWKPMNGVVSGKLDAEIELTFYAQVPPAPDATKPK